MALFLQIKEPGIKTVSHVIMHGGSDGDNEQLKAKSATARARRSLRTTKTKTTRLQQGQEDLLAFDEQYVQGDSVGVGEDDEYDHHSPTMRDEQIKLLLVEVEGVTGVLRSLVTFLIISHILNLRGKKTLIRFQYNKKPPRSFARLAFYLFMASGPLH
uniref:Uncharacterized protein n=1 Tax=Nelumbo nucifera TaxID=4432 RepID=A0A822YTJ5_NELNU|nr:TPA_asm: hypothetical protein HUJ06_005085 [Nelumbo nucifera]